MAKKPKVNQVEIHATANVVVARGNDVLHVDNVPVEAKTVAAQVVSVIDVPVVCDVDGLTMNSMEIENFEEELKGEENNIVVGREDEHVLELCVEKKEESDSLSLFTCSSPLLHNSQVHHDPTLEEHIGLLDTISPTPKLHTDVLALVGMEGKPSDIQAAHAYYDPFLVHFHPIDYAVADFFRLHITMFGKMMEALFIHFLVLDESFYVGIIRCVWPTFIFDPGGFEDESFRRGRE